MDVIKMETITFVQVDPDEDSELTVECHHEFEVSEAFLPPCGGQSSH